MIQLAHKSKHFVTRLQVVSYQLQYMLTTLSNDVQIFSGVENFVGDTLQEHWNSFVANRVMQLPVSKQKMVKDSNEFTPLHHI